MQRQISVLHICDKFGVGGSSIHGISRLFSWWFSRFDSDRYSVRLIGLRPADNATAALEQLAVRVTSLNKAKYDILAVADIVRLARLHRADILHLHGYGASNLGRMAARITRSKTIVHEHFVDPSMPRVQVPFDWALASLTDVGIAVSESVREFMVRERFVPRSKIQLVYNGAPLGEFKPADGSLVSAERSRWGIPPDHRVVGSIGRIDTQKGNRFLLQAATALLQSRDKLTFLIVGDGPLLAELKEMSEQLGIPRSVVFTGYQRDIPLLQSLLDVQVFPSLYEGTPLTLFEAMSMARPIVSTNVDGLGEVLTHERNALVVAPGDAVALAAAIGRLLDHPAEADRLAANALADSSSYDINHSVRRLQSIYETLAGDRRDGRSTERLESTGREMSATKAERNESGAR